MCLIVLETRRLSFQTTGFHPLAWNTVSYCSQRKQAAICKKNLFTDFWVMWLFHGSSSPHFLWEKKPDQTIFLCWCGVKYSFKHAAARPAVSFSQHRISARMLKESTSAGHNGKNAQCKRAASSCPRATSERKHWNLLPRGAPQLPDLCGLMVAKNLLQQLQLWILTASGCLTLYSDRTSWDEPLNSSASFLTHS